MATVDVKADTAENAEPRDFQVGSRDKRAPWFNAEPLKLSNSTRDILFNYSGIPSNEIEEHVYAVRDKAWDIFPYPCIGQWRFLDLSIGGHKLYPEVLERMKSDIRRLVADGADSRLCYGSDLRLDFMELGYELFLDKDRLRSKFIAGNVFDPESDLKQLEGSIDMVYAAAFFHLFNYEAQKKIAHRVMRILKPQPGSLVLGRQLGSHKPGKYPRRTNSSESMFRHNIETWRKIWDEVGEEMGGVKFEVSGEMSEWPSIVNSAVSQGRYEAEGAMRLQYAVRRL